MKGFTLIEVLVSVALLLLITASSAFLLRTSFNMINNAAELEKALNRLELAAEEMRATPFAELANRDFARGAGKIRISNISSTLKDIYITFEWKQGRLPLAVYTMRAR